MEHNGKVAIVTGAGQGLGAAIATRLAAEGYQVVIAEYNQAQATQVAAEITAAGNGAVVHQTDVANEASVQALVAFADTLGPVYALINNAGIYPKSAIVAMTKEEWDRVLAVNLKGAFLCCKYVLPGMMTRKAGRIINLASGHAVRGGAGFSHYSASKAGIVALTKSLALELAPLGILVNTIAPGVSDTSMPRIHDSPDQVRIKTQRMPMGRLVRPAEVADAAAYLLSERNTAITGQLLGVNTGQVLFGG